MHGPDHHPQTDSMREIIYQYHDPLDVIWISTAAQLGISIQRDQEVFASWNGRGTLTIGLPATLDADDSLAQMIFHEICHATVQGPACFDLPDWGLENNNPDHVVFEHACLRLQAYLAQQFELREFFATTTDFRDFYDALPDDPLEGSQESAELARAASQQLQASSWWSPLSAALQATRTLLAIVAPFADPDSLWSIQPSSPSFSEVDQ